MITSGFYNSQNGDRKYNAEQMSAIFDGIIGDGVLATIGDVFRVTVATTGAQVNVGTGRAWFNKTWVYNDDSLTVAIPPLPTTGTHVVDVLVIEVDRSTGTRDAAVKFVPQYVSSESAMTGAEVIEQAILNNLTNNTNVHQYPIAAIYRVVGSASGVTQADITNFVGTSKCPYVTGLLEVHDIDNLVAQWESQFAQWFNSVKANLESAGDLGALATKVGTLENDISGIKNGTTAAGNANKLGGKAASEYATSDGKTPAGDSNKLGGKAASEYAAASHNHKPENITTEGYLGARVMANATAVATLGNAQVRNIYAGTSDMTAGTTALASGAIYIVYE